MFKALIPRWIRQMRNVRFRGGRWRLSVPDRKILEDQILPHFAEREDVRRVLDVGCAWFTRFYHELIPKAEYWTIERFPELQKFGAPNHKAISLLEIGDHFDNASFDLVVCNGVFGWGVDQPEEIDAGLTAISDALRPGGFLLIGWDDNDSNRPEGLKAAIEQKFEELEIEALGGQEIRTDTPWRHVFSFYQRPSS